MKIIIPSHLSDDALLSEVSRLCSRHRDTTASLVAHLAEMDARRLYLGAGFPSLFQYCREVLGLSESETYNRIEAARAARRFPVILDKLSEGAVNLTTVRLLARHLTDQNHGMLLAAATGKGKDQVEELLARHFPRPDVPDSIRKLPGLRPVAVPAVGAGPVETPVAASPAMTALSTTLAPPDAPPKSRPGSVTPLASDRYEVRFTASASTCEKLRRAKDLLRHAVPNGDTAEIVDRALTELLESLARKKYAATRQPRQRSASPSEGSRHIPADVRRAVWRRDGGQCVFVGRGHRRCGARAFLEFHHVIPYACGGPTTVENIQLRCRAHNVYEAELFYGPGTWGEGVVKEGIQQGADGWDTELVPERVAWAQSRAGRKRTSQHAACGPM